MHRVPIACASLAALAGALACGPLVVADPRDSTGAAPAHVTLTFARVGNRADHLDHVNLEIVQVIAFLGGTPGRPADGAPCRPPDALVRDASFSFGLDLHGEGRTPLGRVDLAPGTVGELRLVVSAADVDQRGRHRRGHGRLTCRGDDGRAFIVIRLVPAEHIELERGADEELVARFDANEEVGEEECEVGDEHGGSGGDDCEAAEQHADHGGGGGGGDHGGGGGGGDHGGGGGGGDHGEGGGEHGGGGGHDQGGGRGGGDHGGGGGGDRRLGSRVFLADEVPLTRAR
jgi:uncharacterized membrane protein YgcG